MFSLCLPAGRSGASRNELAEFAAPSKSPSFILWELYLSLRRGFGRFESRTPSPVELRRDQLFADGGHRQAVEIYESLCSLILPIAAPEAFFTRFSFANEF